MADFIKIDDVLNELSIKEDMVAAEFGCGSAHFSMTLAKKLNKGRVFAIDIQEEKLSAIKGRFALEKITNVSTILADLELENGSTLQSNSVDIVLIPNVLFQLEDKNAIIKEAVRVLKSGGELLVIDWLKLVPGHPGSGKVTPESVKQMATTLGLSLKKEFQSGDYHFALLFSK